MLEDVNMSARKADDTGGEENQNECFQTCRVVIIGAGMAGLSAANHLMKNNIHDFVILEARNRVGGRIIAITIGGLEIVTRFLRFAIIRFSLSFDMCCRITAFRFFYIMISRCFIL